MKNLLNAKSIELKSDLLSEQASSPYDPSPALVVINISRAQLAIINHLSSMQLPYAGNTFLLCGERRRRRRTNVCSVRASSARFLTANR